MSILLFFVYLIFGNISIWWCNFFGSQATKLDLSSSLSSSLAWLINQVKPSRAKLKFFDILTSLNSNIVFRLVLSSSQVWAFDFYWQTKLKNALLDKTWLVYYPSISSMHQKKKTKKQKNKYKQTKHKICKVECRPFFLFLIVLFCSC